jgi:hypothetical protein
MATLKALGVEFGSILDVGVSEDTPSLRVAFPGLQHYLFEAVAAHFPSKEKNYGRRQAT